MVNTNTKTEMENISVQEKIMADIAANIYYVFVANILLYYIKFGSWRMAYSFCIIS